MSGLTHVDHFQPGCKVARPKVTSLTVTSSTLPLSNERVSSGRARLFFCIFSVVAIIISSVSNAYYRSQGLSRGRRVKSPKGAILTLPPIFCDRGRDKGLNLAPPSEPDWRI